MSRISQILATVFLIILTAVAHAATPMVASGDYHSLGLRANGQVVAWGNNGSGQLGNNSTSNSPSPVAVSMISGVTMVATGSSHSLALKNDGTVWAWGSNNSGQLGDGTTTMQKIPVQVSGLSNMTFISAGGNSSFAVKNDGSVWAWGTDFLACCQSRTTPIQVNGLANIKEVHALQNTYSAAALRNDGTVWVWGDYILYGNGSSSPSSVPVQANISGVVALATLRFSILTLKSDGTVWGWGENHVGQLGNGTTAQYVLAPVKSNNLSNITAIAGGAVNSYALQSDGSVWSWGVNCQGALGTGVTSPCDSTSDALSPVKISALSGMSNLSAGGASAFALKADGSVYGWGANGSSGSLGDGTNTNRMSPVQVVGIASSGYLNLLQDQGQVPPISLSSLSLSCPSTINAGASGSCTATASYSDATSKSVSASWSSSNSTALPVNSSGSLAAGAPSADTPVTITANYSEGGISKTATASVTVKAAAPTLSGLSVSCPSTINAGASGSCSATASYSNASSKSVSASWSSSNSTALPVNSSGSLTAGTPSADTPVTITANYSEGGVSKTATASVTVKVAAPTLTSLSVSCPSAISSGATGACTAMAGYSNGTSKSVSPAWATYNSTILTVSSGGALTAGNVTSSTSATIAASYTEGGITKTATQAITVTPSNRAPVASNSSLGVAGSTAASGTLSASDPDGNALTFSIVAQSTKGSVTLNNATTGAYTYTPNSGASGTDSFTFKASDGSANSNIATVTLTIAVQALNPPTIKFNGVTTAGTVTMHQGDTCSITFDPVPGAVNYTFYAGNSSNNYGAYGAPQILTDTKISCWTGAAYDVYFIVKANGAGGVQSAPSAEWHAVNIMAVPELTITPSDKGSQGTTTITTSTEISLQVKPVPNATNYKLYYGVKPRAATGGTYPSGSVMDFPAAGKTFPGLGVGDYYFAVKALFASPNGSESEFSNEWHVVVTPLANQVPVANNGSLNITGSTPASGNLSASDPDGNALTYSIITQPAKGSISLNPATGAYTYTPTAGASGSDSFTFKANDGKADSNIGTVTLSLALAPCSFTLASSSYTISASGGSQNVSFNASASSCTWSANSTSSWITIASGAGSQGSGTVTLSIAANTSATARTGTITIAGQTVTITQAGTACTLQLSSSAASFPVSGGSSATSAINGSFGVSASSSECTWAATTDVSWITITNASGKGNATIAFIVQPNTQAASRTGTISVNGQKYTITQEGVQPCAYTLSAATQTFPATGGLGSVDVTPQPATCAWEVASGTTWISLVSQAKGTANGTISFNVAANTATTSRTATLTISGKTYTVTQDGAPVRSLVITPSSLDFGDQLVNTTSSEKAIVITNSGSATIDLGGKILPRLDNFLVPGQDCAVLKANDKYTIRLTFAPVAGGKKAESLEFTDSLNFSYAIALNGNGKTAGTSKVNIDTRVSGSVAAQTLLAVVNANPADLSKTGSLYLVALAPGLGNFYKGANGQWLKFEGLNIAPYQSNVQLGANAIDIVSGLDLSGIGGTQVYAGYGVGNSPQEATANLIKDGTYSMIYTVPKANTVVQPPATAQPTTPVAPPVAATPSCVAPQVLENNQCVTPAAPANLAPYISSLQVTSTPQCLTGCSGYTYQGGADVKVTFTAIDPEGGLVLTKFNVYAGADKFYVDGLTDSIQSASGSAVTSDSLNTGSGNSGYGAYVGLMYACLVPTDGQGNQGAEKCASFEIPSAGSGVTTPIPMTSCVAPLVLQNGQCATPTLTCDPSVSKC